MSMLSVTAELKSGRFLQQQVRADERWTFMVPFRDEVVRVRITQEGDRGTNLPPIAAPLMIRTTRQFP